MGPAQRIVIGLMALALAAAGFAAGRILLRPEERVVQPIVFNHKIHVELMDCDDCHEYFSERAHSGLPTLSACLACHDEAQSDSSEEEKVRTLAAANEDDVFRKLFRLADHAYFSHRRHVSVAGLDCETCHGAIAETELPPERPLVLMNMDSCVDCHEKEGLASECTGCHR